LWDVLADYGSGGGGGGSGDMTKAVYDTDNDGVVDASETVQIIVRNSTGSTLTKGQIVYLSGATGNRPNALLAKADAESTSSKTIGWVVADIANNADGYVGISGTQHNLNTSSFTAGDRLWLSASTAGAMVTTAPTQPNHAVFIGFVARAHPTQGRIAFLIQNGYEIGELHDVLITSVADTNLLSYEASSGLWKNKAISDLMAGYAIDNGQPQLYNIENYPTTSNTYASLYVPSVGKLYVCNNASSTVLIYNVSTGVLLATISVTAAFRPLLATSYASGSSVDEVWITSTSLTTINRISTSTDASLGTITGASTTGFEIINYSSTKCFITASLGAGAMMVINPTTLAVTATVTTNMSSFPSGMALNSNGSSSQNGFIVVAVQSGVLIFNPATNSVSTTVANPSSAISTGREIRYNATKDKYYVANSVGSTFVELSIASSTTFTASTIIRNIQFAYSVQIDESAGYIFVSSVDGNQTTLLVNVIDFTTMALIMTFRTNAGITATATDSSISIDTSGRKLYVIGRKTTSNAVSSVKY